MSQANELPVPTKIPDELWHEIKYLKAALLTFAYNARMCVEGKQLCTGEYDLNFHDWLQPLVETANQMNNIKRYAPTTAEVIPFPKKFAEVSNPHHPGLRSPILTR
jgi:hypothetical protein